MHQARVWTPLTPTYSSPTSLKKSFLEVGSPVMRKRNGALRWRWQRWKKKREPIQLNILRLMPGLRPMASPQPLLQISCSIRRFQGKQFWKTAMLGGLRLAQIIGGGRTQRTQVHRERVTYQNCGAESMRTEQAQDTVAYNFRPVHRLRRSRSSSFMCKANASIACRLTIELQIAEGQLVAGVA
jgi:hypothetical protein